MARPIQPVVLIGTLDTKGPDVAYVKDRLVRLGLRVTVVDSGILGEPEGIHANVSREEVAAAGGSTLKEVRAAGSRGAAVERMARGVCEVCLRLWREHRLAGVLCLGGAEGALLGAAGLRALPVGVPKLLVSPTFCGRRRFAPFVGESDVLLLHSVVDIAGLNPVSRAVLDNAAAAMAGMVLDAGRPVGELGAALTGITMLGNTTPGATALRQILEEAGHPCVVFHANGVGGLAMERLAAAGGLGGAVDFTLAELSNALMDGLLAAPVERLCLAAALPRVVVPGGVDFFNQPAPVPEAWKDRKLYLHNPTSTLVRLLPDEMAAVGRMVAERLNLAVGPLRVVVPTRGFSLNGVAGRALCDPEGDAAFLAALASGLRPEIPLDRVETDVNDPAFAAFVAERYLTLSSTRRDR